MEDNVSKKIFIGGCVSRALLGYAMIAILIVYLLCFRFDFHYYPIGSIILILLWLILVGMFVVFTQALYKIIRKELKEISLGKPKACPSS